MHIYYAHSIKWAHTDGERTAVQVIDYLHTLWHTVSSEEFYTNLNPHLTDKEVFSRDVWMINQSDCILANVTNPSLGVGYELGYSESLTKPIICFYQASLTSKVSFMITWNPSFQTYGISHLEELHKLLS